MFPISVATVTLIAWSKVILAVGVLVIFWLLATSRATALRLLLLAVATLVSFYLVVSWPLQTMLWGNSGDETFVMAALTQSLKSNPLGDFYYHSLPMFYPPLYFWVVGVATRGVAQNAISAHKIGVAATMLFWFVGTYLWALLYRRKIASTERDVAAPWRSPWFWFVVPMLWFLINEFTNVVFKPYEILPGLLTALFLAFFAESIREARWRLREYLFFGISGGVLFLWYYFWWFVAIPVLFVLACMSGNWKKGLLRVVAVGAMMFAIAAIYVVPLLLAYMHGLETWQATFFVPGDFNSFAPFDVFSWRGVVMLLSVTGFLVYRRVAFMRALLAVVVGSYAYQYISIVLFLSGGKSLQGSKPFLFFASAALTVSASYVLVELWRRYIASRSMQMQRGIAIGLLVVAIPQLPMVQFMDNDVARHQLEMDHATPKASELAAAIVQHVPDFASRTWLSSGTPDVNGYIPLKYFVAHNPHFSNPASLYSERYHEVKTLATSTPAIFVEMMSTSTIDAMVLRTPNEHGNYPLYFWMDNYPNGGKDVRIDVPKKNVDALHWKTVYHDDDWTILVKP